MSVLSRTARAIQQVFGSAVELAAAQSGVIQRQRVLTASSLAQTFVLGFMQNPRASDDDLRKWRRCVARESPLKRLSSDILLG